MTVCSPNLSQLKSQDLVVQACHYSYTAGWIRRIKSSKPTCTTEPLEGQLHETLSQNKQYKKGWGYCCVIGCLPRKVLALGLIPNTVPKTNQSYPHGLEWGFAYPDSPINILLPGGPIPWSQLPPLTWPPALSYISYFSLLWENIWQEAT